MWPSKMRRAYHITQAFKMDRMRKREATVASTREPHANDCNGNCEEGSVGWRSSPPQENVDMELEIDEKTIMQTTSIYRIHWQGLQSAKCMSLLGSFWLFYVLRFGWLACYHSLYTACALWKYCEQNGWYPCCFSVYLVVNFIYLVFMCGSLVCHSSR